MAYMTAAKKWQYEKKYIIGILSADFTIMSKSSQKGNGTKKNACRYGKNLVGARSDSGINFEHRNAIERIDDSSLQKMHLFS